MAVGGRGRRQTGRAAAWAVGLAVACLGGRLTGAEGDGPENAQKNAAATGFAASSAADWTVDAQADYKHLKLLCEDNHQRAMQELAAFGKKQQQENGPDFSLRQLLQGEGATLDLTAPYQVHMDAAEILPAKREAADLIGARKFHLLQRYVPESDPRSAAGGASHGAAANAGGGAANAAGLRLELWSDHAEFGIVAGADTVTTGAARRQDAGETRASQTPARMAWPLAIDLRDNVRIEYRDAGAAAAAGAGEAAGAPGAPGALGALGGLQARLARLEFTAPVSDALLTGDRRAGRALFWSATTEPPEQKSRWIPPSQIELIDSRAHLTAEFADGQVVELRASRLYVDLAWNSATGRSDIRFAGLGLVQMTLRRAGAEGLKTGVEEWRLTADACALISLPGEPAAAATPTTRLSAAYPTLVPTAPEATLVLALGGRGSLWSARAAGADPGEQGLTRMRDTGLALFNRGLVELRCAAAAGGAEGSGEAAGGGTDGAPLKQLRRAWLSAAGLPPPDPAVIDWGPDQTGYYQPWPAEMTAQAGSRVGLPVPAQADQVVFARGSSPAKKPSAEAMVVCAQAVALRNTGDALEGVAVGDAQRPVLWQDRARRAEAESARWQGRSLTLEGSRRRIEAGAGE